MFSNACMYYTPSVCIYCTFAFASTYCCPSLALHQLCLFPTLVGDILRSLSRPSTLFTVWPSSHTKNYMTQAIYTTFSLLQANCYKQAHQAWIATARDVCYCNPVRNKNEDHACLSLNREHFLGRKTSPIWDCKGLRTMSLGPHQWLSLRSIQHTPGVTHLLP